MDRRRLETRAADLVAGIVRHLPRRATLAFGRTLGRILGEIDRRHLAIAAGNLRQAFPSWDESRALRTARAVYAHFGAVLLDILWLRSRRPDQIRSLIEVRGREHVERAMAGGKGAVLVGAHLGNWEVHGVGHGLLFGPIHVIARPLDNPDLDRRLCEMRTMGGNVVVYKHRALAQILRAVRDGGAIAILIDQNVVAGDGIFVDFFGRKAATTTVAAAIAVKTGCALVPSRTELLPDGRYRLAYTPALEWTPSGDRQVDIARLTQRLTAHIEEWVRETPEQWLWMHRRWKTRPPEESA
jgi:Kdo2-lipid IVA lauroyltransferase/acyltransferase